MTVKKMGRYRLIDEYYYRPNNISVAVLQPGTIINVTQIDAARCKIFSPELGDWQHWWLPVEAADD